MEGTGKATEAVAGVIALGEIHAAGKKHHSTVARRRKRLQ